MFRVADLVMTDGYLPARVTALVLEWGNLQRQDLLANWNSIRATGAFTKVEPLV